MCQEHDMSTGGPAKAPVDRKRKKLNSIQAKWGIIPPPIDPKTLMVKVLCLCRQQEALDPKGTPRSPSTQYKTLARR